MTDSAFNTALDALVHGDSAASEDALTLFAADLYREEQYMTMPTTLKATIAHQLGLDTGGEMTIASPVSRRTARVNLSEREFAGRPWATAAVVVITISLALTGILQWGMPTGDDGDDRFGILSPAVPTAEATPAVANPAATPADDMTWLLPITADECVEDMVQITPAASFDGDAYAALPERVDEPYAIPETEVRDEVMTQARGIRACNELGYQRTSVTNRLYYENYDREFVSGDKTEQLSADQIVRGQSLSEFYTTNLNIAPDSLYISVPGNVDGLDDYAPGTYSVILPNSVVQLADGRVAVVVTPITTTRAGTPIANTAYPTAGFRAWILIEQDGEWLLDEFLPVCFGECDEFWSMQPGANLLATPVASPMTVASCDTAEFAADYEVHAAAAVNLRPGPGIASGDAIVALPLDEPLMYLCESVATQDAQRDEMKENQVWMKFRTESGDEGLIREVDVGELQTEMPVNQTPTPRP